MVWTLRGGGGEARGRVGRARPIPAGECWSVSPVVVGVLLQAEVEESGDVEGDADGHDHQDELVRRLKVRVRA